jgi:hypothetical protein
VSEDVLVEPGSGRRKALRQSAPRTVASGLTSWDVTLRLAALVTGLALIKLAIYVAAAQPYGGAERGLCEWDCHWYTHTIQNGYDLAPRLYIVKDFVNWAFFPLFPLLGRGLMAISGLDAFWSGTAVSILCYLAFALLSCQYRSLTRGPEARNVPWIVLLTVYPFSIYFFTVYSESTYLLVTILFLLAAQYRNVIGASVAICLLSIVRPTGIIALPYIAIERLWHARLAFRPRLTFGDRARVLADSAFPLAIAPLGLACYMAYLYWLTGDALAFSHAQLAWDRTFSNPIKNVYWALLKNDWYYLFRSNIQTTQAYSASFAILAGLVCLWLLLRRRALEAWLLGATVILAVATSMMAVPRYVMANPVLLLVAGDVMDLVRPRAVRIVLALACIGVQAFLLYTWYIQSDLLL